MKFNIFDGETLINSIEASEAFCISYCEKNGYTFEEVSDAMNIEVLRVEKAAELSGACREAIVFGIDVTLSDGSVGHFSLEETDQINLTTAFNAVQNGAEGYPYHADGQLCRVYPAADIVAISEAATAHKLYHTTYCNHMMAWARRAETVEELEGIVYGAELPEDLAANMAEILTNAAV